MPATTPNSGLPYPLGTDRVMDGDDAIHSLATALDGSNWASLVGVAPFAGQLWWARRANTVTVGLNLSASAGWASNQLITTLPLQARPLAPGTLLLLFTGQGGGVVRTVYVESGGAIKTGEASSTNPFWGCFSFPAANPQP